MSKSVKTTAKKTAPKKPANRIKSGSTKTRNKAAKRTSPAERTELEARERFFKHEAAFILTCFICLFMFLSNFGILGIVGAFTEGLQKGLFGYFAYVFPICIILIVLFCMTERKTSVFWLKIASDIILVISICTMLHLAFGADSPHSFSDYYKAGKNGELMHMAAGGAIGGFIGDALISSIAKTGAWLLMIALSLLCGVVISEKSLISAARKSACKAGETAKAGSEYARNRFEEEKVRLEARREASVLRRKEMEMEKSMRSQEAQVLSPGSSVFDLKAERAKAFTSFGNELTGESDRHQEIFNNADNNDTFGSISDNRDEISLKNNKIEGSENTTAVNVPDMNKASDSSIENYDLFDSDTVPFEETENEKYLAYGKMLSSGKIDLRSAQQMGFAVSKNLSNERSKERTIIEELDSPSQLRAFESVIKSTEIESDESCEIEELNHLHRPLDPDEIIYPEDWHNNQNEIEIISEHIETEETEETEIKEREEPNSNKSDLNSRLNTVEDYDNIFHITDEERASVYDKRESAAKEDKAYKPFSNDNEEIRSSINRDTNKQKDREEKGTEKINPKTVRPYQFPPKEILKKGTKSTGSNQNETLDNARKLEKVLSEFGVGVTVTNVVKGPRVTRYEMTPDVGVKVSRITSLSGDIKLAMAASELRIEAPIPGKSAVGIEIPNNESATVTFRDIMETDSFKNSKSKLTWGVGLDIQGDPVVGDIAKMPHLLVSGTTGSGKSVGINSIIMSVIYRSKPEDVRMILVDPKVVELSVYDGIPHLLAPVVTKPEQALAVLNKACAEMAHRYNLFKESNTRNIIGYNDKVEEISRTLPSDAQKPEKLPYILIIIDELSELMMHSKKDVESAIVSLTQLARAAGIHLVVATQRPSVDVVTGLIKSNIPSRVAYKLPSGIDSRTVLDTYGAENLLGNGDMLYKPGNLNSPLRVQGAYLSDGEVEEVVSWLKKHNSSSYADEWQNLKTKTETNSSTGDPQESSEEDDGKDEYFYEAGILITEKKKASIGLLQRKFKVGFNRASRIMEQLNEAGVVSDGEGTKERQILMTREEFEERF